MTEIAHPLIILGSVRSGTTLLGDLLQRHPAVAYWEEPKHIWRHRHAYRKHDLLTAAEATPAVKQFIRRQFSQFLTDSGKGQFVEKTPSNCFRLPFIREIFPDARFVHLIRDGRAATVSAMLQWQNDFMVAQEVDRSLNSSYERTIEPQARPVTGVRDAVYTVRKFFREKRLFAGGIWFFLEAPAYFPAFVRVFARKLSTNRAFLWGPRFPGIQDVHQTYSLMETCALQWQFSVQSVLLHSQDLGERQYLELHYEELLANPAATLDKIFTFAGLSDSDEVKKEAMEIIKPEMQDRWRQALSDSQIERLQAWLGPLLTQLGYH